MNRVQCFLLVPTGVGRVYQTGDNGERITVGECTEDEHEAGKLEGNLWSPVYVRQDTGERMTFADAPPGAMIDHPWGLTVKLPNGRTWNIDSEASNCTRKGDKSHRCWIRHGTPPLITVDKNGDTCQAGAGSIMAGDYHGFLRNGFLEQC